MKQALLFLIVFTNLSFAQNQDSIQQVINQQVWYPFIETYGNLDAAGFMDIHTDDIIRINRDGKSIRIGEAYAQSQQRSAFRSKRNGAKRSIAFSFTERFASEDHAFEQGYYKVNWENPKHGKGISYGEFQVILKKVEGQWKILVDSDTSHDGQLTEEDFKKGKLLE